MSGRIVVYHGSYGCDTGCCGHYVAIPSDEERASWGESEPLSELHWGGYDREEFVFAHPHRAESPREFAERVLAKAYGAEHVADLDWEHSFVADDF